jgi:hypothetical protein
VSSNRIVTHCRIDDGFLEDMTPTTEAPTMRPEKMVTERAAHQPRADPVLPSEGRFGEP